METLDLNGLFLPEPILKLQIAVSKLAIGEQVTVLTDDPASALDIPKWVARTGNKLVDAKNNNEFTIQRLQ